MTDIMEFLKARIAEDESVALTSIGNFPERAEWSYEPWSPDVEGSGEVIAPNDRDSSGYPEMITRDAEGLLQAVEENVGPHIARHDPARVLSEVAAKRRFLDRCVRWIGNDDQGVDVVLEQTLVDLARVYSDHPDYRAEWGQA